MSANSRSPRRAHAGAALEDAQQRLSRLLIADRRDLPAIIEAAELVRRAERQAHQLAGRERA